MNKSIYQRAHITILKGDKPGAKTYNIENGRPQKGKFEKPFWHDYETEYVDGLVDLYDVLRKVRLDPFKYIIRGKSKLGNAGHRVRRLKETFEETPTPWVCFDFDRAEVPRDPNSETAIEYLIANHLPTCFQDVSYIYQWSNSAGLYYNEEPIKAGTNIHLFFWLDRALTDEDFKDWFDGYYGDEVENGIDISVTRTVTPIYVGSHVSLAPGIKDSISQKFGLVAKGKDVAKVPADIEPVVKVRQSDIMKSSLKADGQFDDLGQRILEKFSELGAIVVVTDRYVKLQHPGERTHGDWFWYYDRPETVGHHSKSAMPVARWVNTFWGEQWSPYDSIIDELKAKYAPIDKKADVAVAMEQPGNISAFLELEEGNDVENYSERYVRPIPLEKGVITIKSPKGTGKTQAAVELVQACKKARKPVLLIGHRVNLLASMSKRLELENYRDINWKVDNNFHRHLAVCVNSINKLGMPALIGRYKVVILDEVEQLIQHLAIDKGTIKPADRKKIMKFFITVLEKAETIVCLDADLSALTRHTIAEILENEDMKRIINTVEVNRDRPVRFFDLKNDLIAALKDDINAGFSTYLATNSCEFTEYFSRYLDKAEVTHIKINSENSHLQEVQEKIQWLGKAADDEVKRLVVLASPSIGTGIDIQAQFDRVYGLFESNVNTHFDMDQQLARVRNPGLTNIWVDVRKFGNGTDWREIRDLMRYNDQEARTLVDYNIEDIQAKWFDVLMNMHCRVKAMRSSSMNNLRWNLAKMKYLDGWNVEFISKQERESDSLDLKALKKMNRGAVNARLKLSRRIDEDEYKANVAARARTEEQQYEALRHDIESFFGHGLDDEYGDFLLGWWLDSRQQLLSWELLMTDEDSLREEDCWELNEKHMIDRNHHTLKRSLLWQGLQAAGCTDTNQNLKETGHWYKGHESVRSFQKWYVTKAQQLSTYFSITGNKKIEEKPIAVMQQFFTKAGLKLKLVGRKRINGELTRLFQLDQSQIAWNQMVSGWREARAA